MFDKVKIILTVLLLSTITFTQGGPLEGEKVLNRPMKYNQPESDDNLKIDYTMTKESKRMSIVWEVYSDRNNNTTYHSPDGNEYKEVQFLDKLYVLKEKEKYLHVVKDPKLRRDTLSSEAVDLGWIPKSKLLLWANSLVTQRGRINRKAMILNTVEQLKTEKPGDKPNIVKFRKGPGGGSTPTGQEGQLFQFFYIYKKSQDGNYYLLGKNSFFGSTSVNSVIRGWVPSDRAVRWFNRVAIEPNWNYESVQERKNNKKVKFFRHLSAAKKYKRGENVDDKEIIWDNDPLSSERLIGEWRRFPVLRADSSDRSILETGVMGDIYTEEGEKLAQMNKKIAKTQDKIDELVAKKRKIKIVFVVDGTRSMSKVFKAVSQGIRNSTEKLNLEYRDKYGKNAIDFAGVIYRDYSEDRVRRVRTRGFQSTQSFESFFDPKKARDIDNNTHAEAPFLGLETALKGLDLNKNQTNVIIHLGDAGNHIPDKKELTPKKIANIMANKYCHYISIQVHKPSVSQAYDKFTQQNRKIARLAAEEYRKILSNKYKGLFNLDKLHWQKNDNHYSLQESPLAAKVIAQTTGESLSEKQIQSEIEKFISGVDASNDSLITKINKIASGASYEEEQQKSKKQKKNDFYTLPFADGIWAVFQQSGLTMDELSNLKMDKYQIYTPGYTTMEVQGQKHDLFKRVLLMDATELGDLERALRKLRRATGGNERREALYNTWLQIIKKYLGESGESENFEELTMEQVNQKLWELPGTNSIIGNLKLKNIYNERKLTDQELNKYIEQILRKHEKIQQIFFSQNYKYGFRSNERPYYWIKESLLP